MFIFAGVDGTGPKDTAQYETDFLNSFVNQLSRMPQWQGYSFYTRGPTDAGFETGGLAYGAYAATLANYARCKAMNGGKTPAVFLSGYSRGGAAILKTANLLHADGLPIECIILFDAVDRTTTISYEDTFVPPNVRKCIHARRDLATLSRTNFGFCHATPKSQATVHTERKFFCTHGGVGGVPWTDEKYTTSGGYIDEYTDFPSGAVQAGTSMIPVVGGVVGGAVTALTLPTRVTLAQEQIGSALTQTWVWSEVIQAISTVMARISDHTQAPTAPSAPPTENDSANSERPGLTQRHTVVSGESLSLISYQYYEDLLLFPLIYDANAAQIGPNWNIIQPGMTFKIPDKKSFSTAELNAARQRARNG